MGGWQAKCTALVHQFLSGDRERLDESLLRLSDHYSLQEPLQNLDMKIRQYGAKAYKNYI